MGKCLVILLLLKYLLACTHSSCSLGSAQFSFGFTPNQVWYKYQDNLLVIGILRMEQKIQRKPCGTVTLRKTWLMMEPEEPIALCRVVLAGRRVKPELSKTS